MPITTIKNIGTVEYDRASLAPGIKGKSIIGVLNAPILISEDLGSGAKLDYVVAHEVGHRLTLDMIVNGYEETPIIFEKAPTPTSGLVRYFITLGLQKKDLDPLHPGVRNHLSEVFDDNERGRYTEEDTAREFVAEVYANWATGRGHIPQAIADRLHTLTKSKNAILLAKQEEGVYFTDYDHQEDHSNLLIGGTLAAVLLVIIMGNY